MDDREALEKYFYMGFKYPTIIEFLRKFHGINMSLRTLKRRLQLFGLNRSRGSFSSPSAINAAIEFELNGPS
jgi:hypothetical protein